MMNPKSGRYFEDYTVGVKQEVGSVSISEADIIEFANKYDPQDFHTDPEKAATGPFGGLIASGWHTISVVMRLLVDRYLDNASSLGSPGIDELRINRTGRSGQRSPLKQQTRPGTNTHQCRSQEPGWRYGHDHESNKPGDLPRNVVSDQAYTLLFKAVCCQAPRQLNVIVGY